MKTKLLISLTACISILAVSAISSVQQIQLQDKEIRTLEQGKPLEDKISGTDVHTYRVSLSKGYFLRAVVEQWSGIGLIVKVFRPDGRKLAEISGQNGKYEPIIVETEAKTSGDFQLKIYALDKMAKPGEYEVRIEELLPAEEHAARLAAKRDTLDAVRRWITNNTIPLRTVVAGNGFRDLQPLKKLIGSAHLVALGEATHGTREFFQLKHRMLEFLVNEMGFTVFGIEATMPEAFDINEYVLTGKGDPAKALASLYMWVWNTEEVLDMIKWMRNYNTDPLHTKKVKFYGFDMQYSPRAVKVTLQNLRKLDPMKAAASEKALAVLSNPFTSPDFVHLPKEIKEEAAAAVSTILRIFNKHKLDYINRGSASEWDIMHQQALIIAQYIESQMIKTEYINIDPSVRDSSMAENIRWILDHEGPGTKMVVWAHNGHVATNTTMGMNLRRMFGNDMVVFGFAFNQGSFQATEAPFSYNQFFLFPSEKGVHPFTIHPFPDVTLDAVLAKAGLKVAAVDLHALPKDGPVARWFLEGQLTHNIGSVFYSDIYGYGIAERVVPQIYDALLFVEKTTAARLNKGGQRPGAPILSAPTNLDFESSEPGKAPAYWLVPKQSPDFDFSVTTSESNPFTGKRCAVVGRISNKHYGEMYGSLSQHIDATSYRGKRIKLHAAVRTDFSDQGNQAYLWLRVTKKFFGPAALLFYDNMADRPITNSDWRDYEIIGEVPLDAETIGYGIALVGDGRAWLDSVSVEVIDK
jgi:erythromycin esterase